MKHEAKIEEIALDDILSLEKEIINPKE